MTSTRNSGRRLALIVATLLAAISIRAGEDFSSSGAGWSNVPNWCGRHDGGGPSPMTRDGRSFEGRGVGLIANGTTAASIQRQVGEGPGVRVVTVPEGIRVEGRFQLSLDSVALAGGSLLVGIGRDYRGGIGVVQAAGLPPIVFVMDFDHIRVPQAVVAELARAGTKEVALRFAPPSMDRFTLINLKIGDSNLGSLDVTSHVQ